MAAYFENGNVYKLLIGYVFSSSTQLRDLPGYVTQFLGKLVRVQGHTGT